jgi:antibiotic biosynthesis monooxygenase (ABM) superfamily enzyme
MRESEEGVPSGGAPSGFQLADGRADQVVMSDPTSDVAGSPVTSVPRYKTAAIIWLAIYPALTVTLAFLGPVLAPLPLFLRTLVVTAVLVPAMVYLLIPAMQRLFSAWLRPR